VSVGQRSEDIMVANPVIKRSFPPAAQNSNSPKAFAVQRFRAWW
jgi:hypothetical protein